LPWSYFTYPNIWTIALVVKTTKLAPATFNTTTARGQSGNFDPLISGQNTSFFDQFVRRSEKT